MHLWTKALACLVLATGIPNVAWSQDWNALGPDDRDWVSQGRSGGLGIQATDDGRVLAGFGNDCDGQRLTVMERTRTTPWTVVGTPGISAGSAPVPTFGFDLSGNPYVAFRDNGLAGKARVLHFDGTNWSDVGTPGISTGAAAGVCMAVDLLGNPYVSFRDVAAGNRATVLHWDGTTWSAVGSPGFSTGEVVSPSSTIIKVTSTGVPIITYQDATTGAETRMWDGSSWVLMGAMLTGVDISFWMDLDPLTDEPVVCYRDATVSGRGSVQRWDGGTWNLVGGAGDLSAGSVGFIEIAVDGAGLPVVDFQDAGAGDSFVAVRWSGATWDPILTPGLSYGTAIATRLTRDDLGALFMGYIDEGIHGKPFLFEVLGTSSAIYGQAGFSDGHAGFPSMDLDPDGDPVVVYRDETQGGRASVKQWNGTDWEVVGAPGFSDGAIDHPDIAVDATGTIYVAYSDISHSFAITVETFDGSSWAPLGAPNFSDGLTNFISMDLDASGRPVVSYRDYAHGDGVTVERWDGTNWVEVGAKGFSGGLANYTSLVMDASDNPVVAFVDGTAGNRASVMQWDGSAWNHVGAAGVSANAARHTSLRIDGSGNLFLAFQELTGTSEATVLTWDGSSWNTVGTAAFTGSAGAEFTSLALDASGNPMLAYSTLTADCSSIGIMRWDGSSWVHVGSSPIEGEVNDEEPTSWLEVDASGRAVVAYGSGYLYAKRFGSAECTDWTLTIRTDGSGGDISYEVIEDGTSTILASGGGFADNALYTLPVCIPDNACFHLVVNDAGGDGIAAPGGWMLQDPFGKRVIDNLENGAGSWAMAQVGRPVCDPVGTVQLIASDCDREDFLRTEFIACSPDPAVSAEWGIGDNSDDGYQFWIFDPVSGFNRKIFRPHDSSGGFGPPTATRACHLRLASMVSVAPPDDVLLNVRVRPCVNGVYGDYGPACRMKIVGTPVSCPTTTLYDLPYEPAKFSCGVTGKVTGGSDKLWLIPIPGATTYKWRFEYPMEGFARNINTTNAALVLGTWYTTPLLCGTYTYDVKVSASFDGGITWCDFGDACEVEITNTDPMHCTPAGAPSVRSSIAEASEPALTIWPNPGTGDHLALQVSGLAGAGGQVQIDLFGPAGRLLKQWTLSTNELMAGHELPLDNELAAGPYVVHVRDGEHSLTQRWIIE